MTRVSFLTAAARSVVNRTNRAAYCAAVPRRTYGVPQRAFSAGSTSAEEGHSSEEREEIVQPEASESGTDAVENNEADSEAVDDTAARLETLEEELKEAKDQHMRALAEMENVRTRAKVDVEKARSYASQGFAKSLLVVADNLAMALDSIPEEARVEGEADKSLLSLYEGVSMTETTLHKAFAANGVTKFGEVGDTFDPHKHEAMFQMDDPNLEPNTLGSIMSAGWLFKDRVLRPAQVGTVRAPPS